MIIKIIDAIFMDLNECKDFLVCNKIVDEQKNCIKCSNMSQLQIYTRDNNRHIGFRCKTSSCQYREPLLRTKICITKYIHVIYLLMTNASYKQLNIWYNLPNNTINKIKNKLRSAYNRYLNVRPCFLGGIDTILQADKTVLSRRGIIRSLSRTDDNTPDTVWILGIIDTSNKQSFLLKRVENRQADTLVS
ncbi:hypothetical protein DMUE_3279, partial [Dictyocoela muelleri]